MDKKRSQAISKINDWKMTLTAPTVQPTREWKPLSSGWLVEGHRRQDEIASFKAIPSKWGK